MATMTIKMSKMAAVAVESTETTIVVETIAEESKWRIGFDDILPSIDFQKHMEHVLGSTAANFLAYMAQHK